MSLIKQLEGTIEKLECEKVKVSQMHDWATSDMLTILIEHTRAKMKRLEAAEADRRFNEAVERQQERVRKRKAAALAAKQVKMRIKEHRERIGLTREQFSEEVGVDTSTVSRWETGSNLPPLGRLPTIARVCGCRIDELYGKD